MHVLFDTQTRRRRDSTSNWDTYSSIYNIIASQSSRASDVRTFPTHRSFLWAEKPGVSKVYAHYGAGAFAGVASNCRYKVREWFYRGSYLKLSMKSMKLYDLNAKYKLAMATLSILQSSSIAFLYS